MTQVPKIYLIHVVKLKFKKYFCFSSPAPPVSPPYVATGQLCPGGREHSQFWLLTAPGDNKYNKFVSAIKIYCTDVIQHLIKRTMTFIKKSIDRLKCFLIGKIVKQEGWHPWIVDQSPEWLVMLFYQFIRLYLCTFTSIYDINIWLIGFSWRQRLFMITLKMIWHLHSVDEVDLLQTKCKRFIHCIFIICWTLSLVTSWSHPSVWRIVTLHICYAFGL